jgi:hypothetical protein
LPFDGLASLRAGCIVVLRQPQDLQGIADGRERIAELMGQGGQEFILAPSRWRNSS